MLTIYVLLAVALAHATPVVSRPAALPPNTLDCKDWTRSGRVWTSNTDAKPFNLGGKEDMLIRGMSIEFPMTIGGYDLAKTLDQKCGKIVKSVPAAVQKKNTTQRCITKNGVQEARICSNEEKSNRARIVNSSGQPVQRARIVNSSGQLVQSERPVNASGQPAQRAQMVNTSGQRVRRNGQRRQRPR